MNATLKVLKSIAEILVIFENEEEQDFLSYEYSTYEYTIYSRYRKFENNCHNLFLFIFLFQNKMCYSKNSIRNFLETSEKPIRNLQHLKKVHQKKAINMSQQFFFLNF